MKRKIITVVMILSLILGGCSVDKEKLNDYASLCPGVKCDFY